MEEWTSLWMPVWFTVCRTVCHWIWMFTTLQNGVVLQNLVPDFTRGDWNKINGYRHAYASPEDEAVSIEKAKAYTAKLKEAGAKEWAE